MGSGRASDYSGRPTVLSYSMFDVASGYLIFVITDHRDGLGERARLTVRFADAS